MSKRIYRQCSYIRRKSLKTPITNTYVSIEISKSKHVMVDTFMKCSDELSGRREALHSLKIQMTLTVIRSIDEQNINRSKK